MEVPSESFHRSSWDSRTCYARRAFNRGLTDDWFLLSAGHAISFDTIARPVKRNRYTAGLSIKGYNLLAVSSLCRRFLSFGYGGREKRLDRWMQQLSWSLSRWETQDIKTQPKFNHYVLSGSLSVVKFFRLPGTSLFDGSFMLKGIIAIINSQNRDRNWIEN